MRQLLILAGLAVVLSGFAGCQGPNKGVEVIIDGGGKFPEFLVGTWKSDKQGWEFTFEPDGTISSARISFGRFRVVPGRKTTLPIKAGGEGIAEPGPWLVSYSPDTRELMVQIVMDRIHVTMGEKVVEGNSKDVFIGTITEEGNAWQVVCTSFSNIAARTPLHPNFDLSEDPVYGRESILTFEKASNE